MKKAVLYFSVGLHLLFIFLETGDSTVAVAMSPLSHTHTHPHAKSSSRLLYSSISHTVILPRAARGGSKEEASSEGTLDYKYSN